MAVGVDAMAAVGVFRTGVDENNKGWAVTDAGAAGVEGTKIAGWTSEALGLVGLLKNAVTELVLNTIRLSATITSMLSKPKRKIRFAT